MRRGGRHKRAALQGQSDDMWADMQRSGQQRREEGLDGDEEEEEVDEEAAAEAPPSDAEVALAVAAEEWQHWADAADDGAGRKAGSVEESVEEVPAELRSQMRDLSCPITHEIFVDPVILCDGACRAPLLMVG